MLDGSLWSMGQDIFGPLRLTSRGFVLHLGADEFPQFVGMTTKRFEVLQVAGNASQEGDKIRVTLANGWAVYRIVREREDGVDLELVESEMAEE